MIQWPAQANIETTCTIRATMAERSHEPFNDKS
jgi:hypothetical protein